MAGKRILVTVMPELYDEIKKMAQIRGVSLSSIANLAIQGGFIALKMAIDPKFQRYFDGSSDAEAFAQAADKVKKGKKKNE